LEKEFSSEVEKEERLEKKYCLLSDIDDWQLFRSKKSTFALFSLRASFRKAKH
jgi:hypothetical protein